MTAGRRTNALTIDVEDYFHVHAFSSRIKREDWETLPCRVERNVERILAMLDEHGARATFFMLGWVAKRYPALVRQILACGHELASHGCEHRRASEQLWAEFHADVASAKRLLEDIAGTPVLGYRAPSFSVGRKNLWALRCLAEVGYKYSSSIYPISHDHYGMPEAPRFAFRPAEAGGRLLELPVTTVKLLNRNLPAGGGGYFRLLPYSFTRWCLERVNTVDGEPCIFYFHPWEIDPEQPRQRGISLSARFRHYLNLSSMESRLRSLFSDFSWDRVDRVFQVQ